MKKTGFTLIELLAVIVILAIIALIAVPIVIQIIDDTKTSSEKESVELYIDSVKEAVARKQLEKNNFNPTTCEIQEDGNLLCNNIEVIVDMKGTKAINGIIEFSNGKIIETTTWLEMPINNYYSYKNGKITKLTEEEVKYLERKPPKEYQKIEYIESTGTQYIKIVDGEVNSSYGLKMKFSVVAEPDNYVAGFSTTNNKRFLFPTPTYNAAWAYGWGKTATTSCVPRYSRDDYPAGLNNIYEARLNYMNDKKYKLEDEDEVFVNGYDEVFTNTHFYLFKSYSSPMVARIYYAKLSYQEQLIRNFVPCYSKTIVIDVNGVEQPKYTIGLYDLVEGKFYTNQGTGEFVKGPDV